jgi:microcystin-dependent protein
MYSESNGVYKINDVIVNCLPGTIVAFPNTVSNDPLNANYLPGWAWCNGQVYNTTENPVLFSMLGSNLLPDLQGSFLRGTGQNLTNPTYTGPTINTSAEDKLKGHTHSTTSTPHSHTYARPVTSASSSATSRGGTSTTTQNTSSVTSGISLASTGTAETIPLSYSINWIIKLG